MSGLVRVGLVDDDPLVLRLLPPQLERHGVVVIWADTAEGALNRLAGDRPQVLAVDGRMPGMDGVEFVRTVTRDSERQVAVMLSSLDDRLSLVSALEAGALGYLIKSDPPDRIAKGLIAAATGLWSFSPGVPHISLPTQEGEGAARCSPLTPREKEVLQLISQSLTNAQIAKRLGISRETAKSHVSSVLNKLNVLDRVGAAMWGVEAGVIRHREQTPGPSRR